MDGAADKVNKLVAGILPSQPHHLSISATQRYPAPTEFWQHSSPLQYTTYVAAGDRGVLLTRPSYDIHEEAEPDAVPPTRPDSKKPVNKMSFKDYQQSKHRKFSESPPDSGPVTSMEVRPAQELHGGSQKPRLNGDNRSRSSQSKQPPPEPRAQSPVATNKKRVADAEDSARPQKRAKSDSFGRSDPDRPSPLGRSVNSKDSPSQGPVNGRNPQRDHVVNGTKSGQVENGYAASYRSDSAARDLVPPLLSPLRLSLDDENDKSPRRRPPDNGGGGGGGLLKPAIKLSRADAVVPKPRQRSPLRLPPLLSPTLPQVVEEELQRLRNTPVKGGGDSSQGPNSQVSDSPSSAKKARTANADAQEDEHRTGARPSLIVTLKYKKRNAKRVMRLLALQPISDRKERSLSIEGTPPPSRKRPVADAPTTNSPSSKRPAAMAEKTISARPMPPSTPLKTTAMSRAASSNSQPAQTPGDSSAGLTPGASERPTTSQGEPNASAAALYQRSDRYSKLGTKLKHDRDAIIKPRGPNGTASQISAAQKKLVAVMSLEMVMSYMIAFKSLNQARQMDRKPGDFRCWEGLLPHLVELRSHTRHFRPLEGLALQLNAVCLEQLVQALTTHSNSNAETAGRLFSASRKRTDAWTDAHHCTEAVGDGSMRITVGPWSSTEDVVRSVLPVIRRWTEREQVDDWKPSVSPPRAAS